MTALKELSSQTNLLIEQKKFDEISDLFTSRNISSRELIIFYKQHSEIFSQKEYWHSKLPLFYFESIIESDLKVNWLTSYLQKSENYNKEVTKKLLNAIPTDFIRFIKYTNAFSSASFLSSLNEFSKEVDALKNPVKEFAIINRKRNSLRSEQEREDTMLLQFPLPYVLTAVSLYYHAYKQQPERLGNRADQIRIEYALVEEVNRIIQLFFSKNRQSLNFLCFKSNEELQKHFNKYCEPHHILGKSSPHFESQEIKLLYYLIRNMIDRRSLSGLIDVYCCSYANFIDSDKEPYRLKTNNSYAAFEFNNKKSQPEEFYLSSTSFNLKPDALKKERIDSSTEERYFKYYGIPLQVTREKQNIDLLKACTLLKHMSVFKGPPERTFTGTKYTINNVGPTSFTNLFGSNESISLFEYSAFTKNISNYFSITIEESQNLIETFSTNLDSKEVPGDWVNNPFIICSGKVLWIGNLLKDRRWSNILLNKIKSESGFKKTVNEISKNVEINAINLFREAGYKAFGIKRIQTSDGKVTDVDMMAYKDGHLIFGEVKSGSRSDDYRTARYYEMIRLEGCAAEQLETIGQYVRENWEKIKTENSIENPRTIESIQIHPLIITDYFEGDLELYKGKYSKVSLLELEVLIRNNKKKLLEMYLLHQAFTNSHNKNYNSDSNKTIEWDLWDNERRLTTELLFRKIDHNDVWKGIEKAWRFDSFEFTLE